MLRFVFRLPKQQCFNFVNNCKRLYSNNLQEKIQELDSFINENNAKAANIFIKKNIRDLNFINNVLFVKYLRYINEQPFNDNVEAIITLCYESLKKKYKILDPVTAENCIVSLSKTKNWKIGLDLLADVKVIGQPSSFSVFSLIKAAFKHYEYDIGWKLLKEEYVNESKNESVEEPFLTLMKSIKAENNYKEFENFLEFASKQCIVVNLNIAYEIREFLNSNRNNECFETEINSSNNLCSTCENHLKKCIIKEEDFAALRSKFYQAVILGKNVFSKTSPAELMTFLDILKKKGPWDLVVDGLNIAYISGKHKNYQIYIHNVERVLNYFLQKRKKILLVGRDHMRFWFKDCFPRIKLKATLFFVENLSQDDPFLLYAAMSSGLGTEFVSRDLMRGHSELLVNKDLKLTFKAWQQLHQYLIDYNGNIVEPSRFLITTQKVENYWHLPYFDEKIKWLCFKLDSR